MNKSELLIILIMLIAALILLSGCVTPNGGGGDNNGTARGKCGDGICGPVEKEKGICPEDCQESSFLTYNNSAQGIRMKYPSDWEKLEDIEGMVVAFKTSKESSSDAFQENLYIVVEDLSAQPMTLEEYSELSISQLEQFITDVDMLDSSATTLNGDSAHKIVYTGKLKSRSLKWMAVWTIKNNKAYFISYTAEIDKYSNFLDTINEMINSFEII